MRFDNGEETMQTTKVAVAAAAIALVAGCATTTNSAPQAQCQYFAENEGLEFVRVASSTPTADGARVEMQLKDALGRPFNATCASAGGKTAWAQPLPANTVRRYQGRDTMAPPAK
jgi:ABC-type phosphate/phosphonate transport system substrate-binding protein